MPEIEIREMPTQRLAAVAHQGAYHLIGPAFARLGATIGAGGPGHGAGGWMGVYHDNPEITPEAELRSHAAAIWTGDGPVPEGLEEVAIPAGRYAVLTHAGPYDGLPAAWRSFGPDLIAAAGAELRQAPALEIYLNDPDDTAPADLRTELCVAVA